MTDGRLRAAVGALALAGIAVTGYLLWAHWADAELLCRTGGCETVQSSAYAELLGSRSPRSGSPPTPRSAPRR